MEAGGPADRSRRGDHPPRGVRSGSRPPPPARISTGSGLTCCRVEQEVQGSRSTLQTEIQATDRRTTQSLTEIQRSVARLGSAPGRPRTRDGPASGPGRRAPPPGRHPRPPVRRRGRAASPRERAGRRAAGRAGPTTGRPRRQPPAAAPSGPPRRAPRRATSTRRPTSTSRGATTTSPSAAFREYIRLYPETRPRREGPVLDRRVALQPGAGPPGPGRSGPGRPGVRAGGPGVPEGRWSPTRGAIECRPRSTRKPWPSLELGQAPLAEARLQFLVDQFPSTEEAAKAKDELARIRKR